MKRLLALVVGATLLVGMTALPAQAGTIYEVTHAWGVDTRKGRLATPSMQIDWEVGARYVKGIVYFACWDGRGYADFTGCEKSHSKIDGEHPSAYWQIVWHYRLGFDPVGLVIKYYCRASGNIYADGRFTSNIVCDYGSG